MDEAELWEYWLIGGLRVGHVEYDQVKAASMKLPIRSNLSCFLPQHLHLELFLYSYTKTQIHYYVSCWVIILQRHHDFHFPNSAEAS